MRLKFICGAAGASAYLTVVVISGWCKPPPTRDYPMLRKTPPPSVTPAPSMRTVTITNHVPPLPGQTNATETVTSFTRALPLATVQPTSNNLLVRSFEFTSSPNWYGVSGSNVLQATTNLVDWTNLLFMPTVGTNVTVNITVDPKAPEKLFRLGPNRY